MRNGLTKSVDKKYIEHTKWYVCALIVSCFYTFNKYIFNKWV